MDDCHGGIYCFDSDALIECNTIQNNVDIGMDLSGGSPTASQNIITANTALSGAGIYCRYCAGVSIYGNLIQANIADSGGGIRFSEGSGEVCGNSIIGNDPLGISFYLCDAEFTNNVVALNTGEYVGGCTILRSAVAFANNTFYGNTGTGPLSCGGGLAVADTLLIDSSVFWSNGALAGPQIAVLLDYGVPSVLTTQYCNIEDGQDSIYVEPGCTLIWGPGNIDQDPLFETGPLSDYHLSSGSPCIDAGNPDPEYNDPEDPLNPGYALWPALGGLRNDMGAYGGGGVGYWVGIEEETETPAPEPEITLRAFPNPFQTSATLVFELAQPGPADLRVYDLSGRLVEELFSGDILSGPMSCWMDGSYLPSGVYLARLQAGDQSATVRLVKL